MDDDEFAELYGSSAVEEPVAPHKPAAANGAPVSMLQPAFHTSRSMHRHAASDHRHLHLHTTCCVLAGGLVAHQSLQPPPAAAAAARNDDYDDLYGQVVSAVKMRYVYTLQWLAGIADGLAGAGVLLCERCMCLVAASA